MTRASTISPVKYLSKRERIYHHYEQLEEYHAGMWKIYRGEKRKDFINKAADLMRCPDEFKLAMQEAVRAWIKSCEANLTADSVNKIAWLGHAGCCVATGSPEDCTRAGWHLLNQSEQDEANRVVGEVLEEWLKSHRRLPDLFG